MLLLKTKMLCQPLCEHRSESIDAPAHCTVPYMCALLRTTDHREPKDGAY